MRLAEWRTALGRGQAGCMGGCAVRGARRAACGTSGRLHPVLQPTMMTVVTSMDLAQRKAFTDALSWLAAGMRVGMLAPDAVGDRALALHREERVNEVFDLWTDP
jgi:hypothetical protein